MTDKGNRPGDAYPSTSSGQALRQQAQEIALGKAPLLPENLTALSSEGARLLLHELRVHQIELEMQNEELRRTQDELEASRARYFDLYDLAPVGYFAISEQGLILEANLTAAGLLGVPRGALVNQVLSRFILTEDQNIYYLYRKQLFGIGEPQTCELRMVKKDGTAFWASLAATATQDVDGAPVCRAVMSDITESKRVQEALQESKRRLTSIYDTVGDAVFHLAVEADGSYRFVSVNQAFRNVTGLSEEMVVGKLVNEVIPEPSLSMALEKYRRAIEENSIIRWEEISDYPTGRLTGEVSIAPVVDDKGRCTHLVGAVHDVTNRKHAEAGLRESEQKLKATVYGSPIPQFVIDRDHRVVYWNKALEDISGRKAEEMVGTSNHWSAFYKEKRPCMCDLLVDGNAGSFPEWYGDQCRESRLVAEAFEVTDFFPHLGEGGKWLFFTAASIKDLEGNIIGAMETLEDVTGRIKAEMEIHQLNEELEQRVIDRTAQLQAANKELEAFSYSVSHDLRAPLRALDGFSRILIEDYAAQLPEEAVGHLNRVRNGASHMGHLIDDLLRFSRLSRQPLEKQPVNLSALVEEIWSALESERKGRQVDWVIGSLPECQGDPSLLRQVFFNLLGNALKYSRLTADARIEIGFLPQVVRAGEAPATNVYFVRDNGVGFDMQFAGKLFGVFQRLHRPDEYEGTGVGLAIVHRIIARHGGRIWAESEPDKGATFYLTIGDAPVPTVPTAEKAMV